MEFTDGDDGNLPDTYEAGGPARPFGWLWLPSPASPGATPCPGASALERLAFRLAGALEMPSRTLPRSLGFWSSDPPLVSACPHCLVTDDTLPYFCFWAAATCS